jgi:hypothetical protein
MANRQVFPAALFPLRGDVSAEAGATAVTVTGIQGSPVLLPLLSGGVLVWINGAWTPTLINGCVLCNGVPVSGDYAFFNLGFDFTNIVGWSYGFDFFVFQDGIGVIGTETGR